MLCTRAEIGSARCSNDICKCYGRRHIATAPRCPVIRRDVSLGGSTSLQYRDVFGTVRKGYSCRNFAFFFRRAAKYPPVHHVSVPGKQWSKLIGLHATQACSQRKVEAERLLCSTPFILHAMRRAQQNKRPSLCFTLQDHVGPDLQKVLWAGLGPEAGEMLSPRTSFLIMPLFTLGSLEVPY